MLKPAAEDVLRSIGTKDQSIEVAKPSRLVAVVTATASNPVTLKTLGDVRKMLLGLPEAFQSKTTWGHVAVMLDQAARGGDITDVVVPLRMVLGMEGVVCRPK